MSRQATIWRLVFALLLLGLILATAGVLVVATQVLLLLFGGVLFGVFINGLAGALSDHTRLRYLWCYIIVATLLILLVVGTFYFIGWRVAGQASLLWSELQAVAQEQLSRIEQSEWAQRLLPDGIEISSMLSSGEGVMSKLMAAGQWLTWGVTGIAVIFFVGLYTAYHPSLYEAGLVSLLPMDQRQRAEETLQKLRNTLRRWIIGRLVSMAVIGVFTALGLWLLGVPLAGSLGVLAAVLTFIPNIGPIMAAIPQALLALNVSTTTAVYVILFNIALQGAESYLLTPIIQRYQVSLPPALTILVQLLMAVLFGIIGIIFAAPLTAALMVIVQTLYIRDELGDDDPGLLAEKT